MTSVSYPSCNKRKQAITWLLTFKGEKLQGNMEIGSMECNANGKENFRVASYIML